MKTYAIRHKDGSIDIRSVEDEIPITPEALPVIVESVPAFDSKTHKRVADQIIDEVTQVILRPVIVPLDAGELAELAEQAIVKTYLNDLQALRVKMKAGTATATDRNNAIEMLTGFVIAYLKHQGLP